MASEPERNVGERQARERFEFDPQELLRRAEASAGADQPDADYQDRDDAWQSESAGQDQFGSGFKFEDRQAGPTKANFGSILKAPWKLKKGGPTAFVAGGLLAGGMIISSIMTPALLINHVLELLTDSGNMQAYSGSVRTAKLVAKKWRKNSSTSGLTEKKNGFFKKKERFATITDATIERGKLNGMEFETETTLLGRKRITKIEVTDPSLPGGKMVFDDAASLRLAAENNPVLANKVYAVNRGQFGMMFDGTMTKIKQKLKIINKPIGGKQKAEADEDGDGSRSKKSAEAEADEELNRRVNAEPENLEEVKARANVDEADEVLKQDANEVVEEAQRVRDSGFDSKLAIAKLAGIVDKISDGCAMYNVVNKTIYAAKIAKSAQLARYAGTFLSLGSALRAGDATEEQIAYFANKLTATNPIQKEVNGHKVIESYEPTALDSQGMYYAMTGMTGPLNDSAKKFQLGMNESGAIKTFLAVKSKISSVASKVGLNVSQACLVMDSNLVASVGVGLTAVACAIGGAAGCAAAIHLPSILAGIGVSLGVVVLKLWLANTIKNAMGGNFANSKTQGEDMGNALYVGSQQYMGQGAMAGGNMPLSKDDALAYMEAYDNYVAQRAEQVRATTSPFDPTTRHTMMGSVVSGMLPYLARMQSVSGRIGSVLDYGRVALTNVLPKASALSEAEKRASRKAAFDICSDPEYRAYGGGNVALDPFCNFVLGVPKKELNSDRYSPNEVLEFLAPGTFELQADGKVTDHMIEYTADGSSGHQTSEYFSKVLGKGYLKTVDHGGQDCHAGPIIVNGELISSGYPGPYTDQQVSNPCLNEAGDDYQFEWRINDRKSVCAYYLRPKYDDEDEEWRIDTEIFCPKGDSRGRLIPFRELEDHKANPLYKFKMNCINRGQVPFGLEELQEAASQEHKKTGWNLGHALMGEVMGEVIDNGERCVLTAGNKERIMFALYFMDERVQCMLDDSQDCDTDAMINDVETRASSPSLNIDKDESDLVADLPDPQPGDGQRDVDGCQPPPKGASRKYDQLTDDEIRRITAAMMSEQGSSVKAIAFEASLLANLTDKSRKYKSPREYLLKSGWFNRRNVNQSYNRGRKCNNGRCWAEPTEAMIAAVDNVLRKGDRTTVADEHDTFGDIAWIKTGDKKYTSPRDIRNRKNYVNGKTVIKNRFGALYKFDCFPSRGADPFGKKFRLRP